MSIFDQLGGILNQYSSGKPPHERAASDFQQVAEQAPQHELGSILGSIFRSPETGSFGDNVASMYGLSNTQQRAGILGKLLSAAGISHEAAVTHEQARQTSPDQVKQIADQAEQKNPGVVQQAADFYSQHPQLVQALGTGVAIWAMQRLVNRQG